MRLVFLGSPPFATAVLARLVASPFRPELVITQPAREQGRGRKLAESPIAALARAHAIELLEPETVRDEAVLARLRALAADVYLVVSYGEILRPEFLALPRVVALNVHPSLLPRHRGATPIPAALLAGDEVTGVAIQKVARELDAGELLLVRETPIEPGETAGELAARLSTWSGELVLEALAEVESGRARYVAQDHARATYCKKLTKEDGRLDWTRPAVELERRVRAMNPGPARTRRCRCKPEERACSCGPRARTPPRRPPRPARSSRPARASSSPPAPARSSSSPSRPSASARSPPPIFSAARASRRASAWADAGSRRPAISCITERRAGRARRRPCRATRRARRRAGGRGARGARGARRGWCARAGRP